MGMFHKIQILPASIQKTHFLKFIHLLVGGNISQLVYLTPHPRFWSSDCLHIMKWLWSITLLKMMKISYIPDIFCLFTLISQLKWGATYPSYIFQIFEQWLAMDSELLFIVLLLTHKIRYCLLVYENPFLEIHPFTGGGQHIPAGLSYPPPMMGGGQPIPAGLSCPPPRFLSSEWLWVLNCWVACWGNLSQLVYLTPHPRFWSKDCLHIMKWLWSITLLKMMKMCYNPDIFCLFTLISHLK